MKDNTRRTRRKAGKRRAREASKKKGRDLAREGKGPRQRTVLSDIEKVFGAQAAAAVSHATPSAVNVDVDRRRKKEEAALSIQKYGRIGRPEPLILTASEAAARELDMGAGEPGGVTLFDVSSEARARIDAEKDRMLRESPSPETWDEALGAAEGAVQDLLRELEASAQDEALATAYSETTPAVTSEQVDEVLGIFAREATTGGEKP